MTFLFMTTNENIKWAGNRTNRIFKSFPVIYTIFAFANVAFFLRISDSEKGGWWDGKGKC